MTLDLDAMEALEKKATQGEWTTQRFPNGCHFDRILRDGYTVDGVTYVPDYEHPMLCKDDAALIAAARNALPELIRLARIGQRAEREVVQIGLCEIRNLTLKADTLYRFKKMHQCVSCQNYEDGK